MVFYSTMFLIKEFTLQKKKCGNVSGQEIHRFHLPETSGLIEWWNIFEDTQLWCQLGGNSFKCWGKVLQKTIYALKHLPNIWFFFSHR